MALQIRRAHRFFPPPQDQQDQIGLCTSNRANKAKVSNTFPISLVAWGLLLLLFQLIWAPNTESAEKWLIYADNKIIVQKLDQPKVAVNGFQYIGYIQFTDLNNPRDPMYSQPATIKAKYIYHLVFDDKTLKPDTGKPVITKQDDTHVVLYSTGTMDFVCTKQDDAFTQVDAPLVQPTGYKVAQFNPDSSPLMKDGKQVELEVQAYLCDLESRDKGNTRITFNIEKKSEKPAEKHATPQADENTKKEVVVSQAIRVHELYRFRITSGPVFSTLATKNRSFSVITNSAGQQVISSSRANDSPANFPIFLKCYCFSENGRDILEKPEHFYEYFSPIVGVNLVDNPLKNFYAGLSFEPVIGVDFVIGAHFAKISQLAGGFADGQVVTIANPPPVTSKFLTGGFAGITVDVGIVGSWLGTQFTKTIKEGFR